MGFCTRCGRQRSGPARFCTGCGAPFNDVNDPTPLIAEPSPEPPPAADWAPPAADWGSPTVEPAPPTATWTPPATDWAPPPAATPEPAPPTATWTPSATDWAPPAETPDPGPGETRADFWSTLSAQPAPHADPTRWDTDLYKPKPGPAAQPQVPPADRPPSVPATEPPRSSGSPGYGPPSYAQGPSGQGSYGQPPSYQAPPHVPGAVGSHPLRRGQSAILITLLIVALLAVGGGAYLLVSRFTGHKTTGLGSGSPTISAPAKPASSAATTKPASPARARSATPSPRSSRTPAPTASPTAVGLIVSPAASANPAEPGVAALVGKYFAAINQHSYSAYRSLLNPQMQAALTRSSFESGYGSTTDVGEKLTSITNTSGGGKAATLLFTSKQSPAHSATGTACTSWSIVLYLQPNGSGYLIGGAPPGYHARYAAC